MGKLIIFSAPSGSGKTTIVRELLRRIPQLEFSISATSRAPRGTERDGVDYYFLSPDEFRRAVDEERFVEWEEVYAGTCYGTLRSELDRIWGKGHTILFDVDVLGGINLKRIFGADACSVFIMPPSIEELERRLELRGTDAPEVIAKRVAKAEFELTKAPEFDHVVVNDVLDTAVAEVERIVRDFRVVKHVVLYFGSFNPVHRGHIALAEWVAEHVGCDEVVLVVSPKNPLKADDSLAPELNRFEMAELACARSRFPERIKPSVIEFLLEKPSYTIDTLRYLSRNYGGQMRFSVLLGADLVPQLERWRDYREILDGYPLLVYPRRGFETTQYLDRITLLNEAPLCDFSSTEVRRALEQGDDASAMLTPEVLAYIREKRLWDPVRYAERLTERIGEEPCNAALLVERGRWYYRRQEWGKALNDFNRALGIDPARDEARQYAEQIEEILAFRYKDIYNP